MVPLLLFKSFDVDWIGSLLPFTLGSAHLNNVLGAGGAVRCGISGAMGFLCESCGLLGGGTGAGPF